VESNKYLAVEAERRQRMQQSVEIRSETAVPPFNEETARQKVKAAQDGWNTRDPRRWRSHTRRTRSGATATSSSRGVRRSWRS
jgi:hypothetical protein